MLRFLHRSFQTLQTGCQGSGEILNEPLDDRMSYKRASSAHEDMMTLTSVANQLFEDHLLQVCYAVKSPLFELAEGSDTACVGSPHMYDIHIISTLM